MTYNQEDETLEIILGDSREITVNTSGPRQLKRKAVYSHASNHQPVYIHRQVWNHLWKYSKDNQNREVGGVLVGKTVIDSGVSVLEVTGFIEGRHMKEKVSSLTFTHETWNDINTRRKEEYPDKKIVGWFHTHPGHGIFLSRYDLFIHQNFFPGKDQIAVVFDPLRGRYGFFVWEADQVRQSHNVFLFVYGNEDFDQEVENLPYIGNTGQHTDSQGKPHIDVNVDMQEVTEEEQGNKPFEKMFETAYRKSDESDPVSPEIVPISPVENRINSQPVVSDESRPDTAGQDSSPIKPGVKIDYSGEMILSQNNLTPEINAIREKGMNEFQRIKQEISQGNITKGKPGPNNPDKS